MAHSPRSRPAFSLSIHLWRWASTAPPSWTLRRTPHLHGVRDRAATGTHRVLQGHQDHRQERVQDAAGPALAVRHRLDAGRFGWLRLRHAAGGDRGASHISTENPLPNHNEIVEKSASDFAPLPLSNNIVSARPARREPGDRLADQHGQAILARGQRADRGLGDGPPGDPPAQVGADQVDPLPGDPERLAIGPRQNASGTPSARPWARHVPGRVEGDRPAVGGDDDRRTARRPGIARPPRGRATPRPPAPSGRGPGAPGLVGRG